MSNTGPSILLIAVLFVIGFSLLWSFVLFLISHLGGWASLARQYPALEPATGKTFSWQSARFGLFSSYQNSLNVTLSAAGLHMRPVRLLGLWHEPVLIPWNAVQALSQRNLLLTSAAQLTVADPASGRTWKITFYGRTLTAALEQHVRP